MIATSQIEIFNIVQNGMFFFFRKGIRVKFVSNQFLKAYNRFTIRCDNWRYMTCHMFWKRLESYLTQVNLTYDK